MVGALQREWCPSMIPAGSQVGQHYPPQIDHSGIAGRSTRDTLRFNRVLPGVTEQDGQMLRHF
jgi:hypothetical protein